MREKRAPIPRAVRAAVFARDGSACVRCQSTERVGLDHIIPVTKGGTDEIENLRVLCRACNSQKRDSTDPKHLEPLDPSLILAMGARITAARAELDAATREYDAALAAAHAKGHTHAEIAAEVGVTKQAIQKRLARLTP